MTNEDQAEFWVLYDRIKTAFRLGPENANTEKCLNDAYLMAAMAHDLFRERETLLRTILETAGCCGAKECVEYRNHAIGFAEGGWDK